MLFTAADILTLQQVKVLEQQLNVNSLVIESVEKITGIHLSQKDIKVKNGVEVKITTSGAKKMVIILHRDEIWGDLQSKGLNLKV